MCGILLNMTRGLFFISQLNKIMCIDKYFPYRYIIEKIGIIGKNFHCFSNSKFYKFTFLCTLCCWFGLLDK